MELYAMALYGIAWFDEQETFHDEWLRREPLMLEPPFDLWVATPTVSGMTYHFRPQPQRYTEPDFAALRDSVLGDAEDVWMTVASSIGDEELVFATPAFAEASDEQPVAMIAVVAQYAPTQLAIRRFGTRLLAGVAVLGVAGLAVGAALSWWSLKPAVESLRQREKFLAGAAHELRTPLATLRSIVDGARSGAEPAEKAMQRIGPMLEETGQLVSDLLLFARLDSGHEVLRRERVRLDLLVETCVPEDQEHDFQLDLAPTEVSADPRLAATAIRNLLINAIQHGADEGTVCVSSTAAGIVVTDDGPGYRPAVLAASSSGDFRFLPSTGGAGAGLALVQLIAHLHSGRLILSNRERGGARAELSFDG